MFTTFITSLWIGMVRYMLYDASLSLYIIYMFKERNKNNIQLICKLDLGSHDSSIVVCNGKPLTLFGRNRIGKSGGRVSTESGHAARLLKPPSGGQVSNDLRTD